MDGFEHIRGESLDGYTHSFTYLPENSKYFVGVYRSKMVCDMVWIFQSKWREEILMAGKDSGLQLLA